MKNHWPLALLVGSFLVLAISYSVINPIHEGTDELRHYRFVRYLVENRALPVQGEEACRSQSHHPPLIYALGAVVTAWVPHTAEVCANPSSNPFWAYRYWDVGTDNKNMYLHPATESFPWAGDVLAARLVRLVNVGLGALTLVLTYATAVLIWPRNRAMAVGSTAILAFSPMFLYMAGTINNDVIAALSGSAVMYASVRLLLGESGFGTDGRRGGLRWGLLMGGGYALALMSKFNLAPIAAVQVLVMTYVAWRHKQWGAWLISGVVMFVTTAVLAGWWFLRNQLIYGEPTGVETLTELWGVRSPAESFWLVVQELPNAWSSLWGRFGFGQIPLPELFYTGMWLLTVVAGVGLLWALLRALRARRLSQHGLAALVLFLLVLTFFTVLFAYMLISPAGAMGRFFFPGLPALVILLFVGLALWPHGGRWGQLDTEGRATQATAVLVSVLMASTAVWALLGYLAPAYAAPRSWSEAQTLPNPTYLQFDNFAALRGYEVHHTGVSRPPGESMVQVDLYWEVLEQPIGDFYLFAHLQDELGIMVAQRDTHPGLGKFPTSQWRPGDRFVDTVYLWLPETAYPSEATVSVGLYAPEGYRLQVWDSAGEWVGDTAVLAHITIPTAVGEFPNPLALDKSYEGRLRLVGYEFAEGKRTAVVGDTLTLTLYWERLVPLEQIDGLLADIALRPADGHSEIRSVNSLYHQAQTNPDTPIIIDTHFLPITSENSPAIYDVHLRLFDIFTEKAVILVADKGHQIDNQLSLGSIVVE